MRSAPSVCSSLCDAARPRRHRGRSPTRSSSAARPRPGRRIRELPAGTYHASAELDLADGSRIDIVCAITVDPVLGEILVDYAGSSGASPYGINVVKNYTHAYTTFAVRSVLNPELPNNHGSLAPIKVEAPVGSIVNAVSPQPCTARHVVGMFLPNALLKALAQIKPEQAMAEGSGAVWTMQVSGQPRRRSAVHHGDVHLRRRRRRPSHTSPGCRRARTPPVSPPCRSRWSRRRRRSGSTASRCAPGSGGGGEQIGGMGQTVEFTVDTDAAVAVERRHVAARRATRGHLRRWRRCCRLVHRQRRGGANAAADHVAAGRPGQPRTSRWRRLRRCHPKPREAGTTMTEQSVLTADLLASFDDSVLDVDQACTLPPVCYTADEFLEFERRALSITSGSASAGSTRSPIPATTSPRRSTASG